MKISVCLAALLIAAWSARASDISDLAAGYANAFGCMGKSSVCINYSSSGQTEILKDVKEIKAFGGALLVKFDNGDQIILNAGDVLRIAP